MKKIGCIAFLLVIPFICLEIWVFYLSCYKYFPDRTLDVILVFLGLSVLGYYLFKIRIKKLQESIMTGDFAKTASAIIGCVLMIIPGVITGAIGLLLQIPVFQKITSKFSGAIIAAIMRQATNKMMGGAGGFPPMGGMGEGFPDNFPGFGQGAPQSPSKKQKALFDAPKKKNKIYDINKEK